MTVSYRISENTRLKFKDPFGELIQGTPEVTMKKLEQIVKQQNPPKLIAVGDIVSRNIYKANILMQVAIIDNQSLREKVDSIIFPQKTIIHLNNPQGTITKEAIAVMEDILKNDKEVQIVVEGEEDLLTLIAVLFAPENSLVIYGQPREGIVIVKVTLDKKLRVKKILEEIKV
ncbi:MAG: DUF359 domain-containing protein [Crenarchaeota archaeon]|nr:DUF359 domain-containing protein [Thermoproteota archaeon]